VFTWLKESSEGEEMATVLIFRAMKHEVPSLHLIILNLYLLTKSVDVCVFLTL